MRRNWRQEGRWSFLAVATTAVATTPWIAALSLSEAQSAIALETLLLETDVRAAWISLLGMGSSSNSSSSDSERHGGGGEEEEGTARAKGPRELVDRMLVDCHGRPTGGWGAECDRALYFNSVLEKIRGSSSSSSSNDAFAFAAGAADAPEDERRRQETLDAAASEIAAVPAGELPFSTFFHEYAVPGRPVVLFSQDGVDTPTDLAGEDARGDPPQLDPDPAKFATDNLPQAEKERRLRTHERLVNSLEACLPYPVNPVDAVGTVDGPVHACRSMLEDLQVPLHVSEDFAQRFRGRDVLPMEQHPEVDRFVSGWHRIHRTRRGAYIPATACPAGANTLVTVLSGNLDVSVYAPADGMPCLKPTYGKASCADGVSSSRDESLSEKLSAHDVENDGNQGKEEKLSGGSRGDDGSLTSPRSDPKALLMEAFGLESERAGQGDRNSFQDVSWEKTEISKEPDGVGEEGDVWKVDDQEELRRPAAGERVPSGDSDHSSPQRLLWPHEPRYCADIWRQYDEKEAAVTRKNIRSISDGDLLFVPSGGAVSWRAKEGNAEYDETVAVHFCYVDASNFNSVKRQLPLYAAVEPGASGLLQAFRSPVFDTSMNRDPSTISASDFLAGGRHAGGSSPAMSTSSAPSASTSTSSGEAGIQVDSDGATEAAGGRQGRRRLSGADERASSGGGVASSGVPSSSTSAAGKKGGRRGRKSFKEWQDDSRWDLKVLGLTLPTLSAPRVRGCERTTCAVEWTSSFVKRGQDQTKLGFNLSFVPAVMSNGSMAASDGRGDGSLEVFVGDSRLKSEHALDRDLLNLGITEGKRHTVVIDTGLVPDTLYRFSVSVIYGETAGPFSEFSKPGRTSTITAPLPMPRAPAGFPGPHAITLRFVPPQDDGGSPVSWYHVMSRPIGENVLSKWQAVGMAAAPAAKRDVSFYDTDPQAVAVKVDHLLPGVAYEFRVCAQNDVGTSPWSAPSDAVVALAAAEDSKISQDSSLSGFHPGHQHLRLPNVTEVSVSYAGETQPPPGEGFDPFEREVQGPTVVLDDRASKVQMASNSSIPGDIDVWTCHFSPRSFRVKAEAVVARPADAQSELENSRFVRNRVVVVERGNTPIVHKVLNAQRAGALGVIVADDGRCGGSFGQLCVHGSDPPEGWAALDMPRPWLDVRVPVVLMLREDAERLTAAAGAAEEEAQSMAWTSLYGGWLDSVGSSSWSSVGDQRESSRL